MKCFEKNNIPKYFKDITISKTEDQHIKISWQLEDGNSPVTITWSTAPSSEGSQNHIATVIDNDSIIFTDPDGSRRNFYSVSAEGYHTEIVAEPIVPLQGVSNFRDLGGYKTTDGRRVKWNTFYRSAELASLTTADVEYLQSLGIKTIFDYRSKPEVMNKPDPIIANMNNINVSGMPSLDEHSGNFDMALLLKEKRNLTILEDPAAFLKNGYIEMVTANQAFKKMLECVANPAEMPIVQHCTAGKDRTGFGSALLLLALGVAEEIVMEDYLLTNRYRGTKIYSSSKTLEHVLEDEKLRDKFKVLMEARREYLESSLQTIKAKYGSYETYFKQEYGLDEGKRTILQEYYLE